MDFLIDKVITLKAISIFKEVPQAELLSIAEIMEKLDMPENSQFIKKGEIAESMYIILNGKVKVHDGNSIFAHLGKHEIVGELALLTPIKRTASVTTTEDSVLYKIDRTYFLDLLYEKPEILKGIIMVLSNRIIKLNKELKDKSNF